jgi:hypothetical protein
MSLIIKDDNKRYILNLNSSNILELLVYELSVWNPTTRQYDLTLTDTIDINGGVTDTFLTGDGRTATVVNGLIISII